MRTLLIDPKEQTVTEHTYDGNWKTIGPTIGADYFDAVYTDDGDIYVDGEGLIRDPQHFWMLDTMPNPIAGKALVFGLSDENGDSTAATLGVDDLRERIKFFTIDEVRFLAMLGVFN
jgi:hypothetical protein